MRLSLGRSSLVFVGSWNVAIFTRDWLTAAGLVPVADPELAIANGRLGFRFTFGDAALMVVDGQMNLVPSGAADGTQVRCGEIADVILERLPQTPVTAFGINVCFDVLEHPPLLEQALAIPDTDALRANGVDAQAVSIVRAFRGAAVGATLVNMTIARASAVAPMQIDLNHHFELRPPTGEAARNQLRGQIEAAHDASLQILRGAYGLEITQ